MRGDHSILWATLTGLLLSSLAGGEAVAGRDASLEPAHAEFLAAAAPLLSPRERDVFLSLGRSYQRQAFIEAFWRARNPFPETPFNELRHRWEQGLEQLEELFGGLQDQRARVWLLRGPTSERLEAHCRELLPALEIWTYAPQREDADGEVFVFAGEAPKRLWDPAEGLGSLAGEALEGDVGSLKDEIRRGCRGGSALLRALESARGPERLELLAARLAPADDDWLDELLAASTQLPPGARSLAASLTVQIVGAAAQGTAVDVSVRIPATCCPELGDRAPRFHAAGEVVRRERLHERFRYRFEPPVVDGETIVLPMERHLPAGAYRLHVLVEAEGTRRYFRAERDLEVPWQWSAAVPAAEEAGGPDRPAIELLPVPGEGPHTGRVRVEATVVGADIERVVFLLNDRPILSRTRPPYATTLNLGDSPRSHALTVHGLDAAGRVVARDERVLNAGPHRFFVRLLEPRSRPVEASSLRAVARVEAPEGAHVERVELHVDEARVATLHQPPWIQTLPVPAGEEISLVRATAYLADGLSREDLRILDGPAHGEAIQVDFVELYTTVVDRRGRPVEDLKAEEIAILENGIEQRLRRFDRVEELSIHAVLVIDTSLSMAESLPMVEEAALRFFRDIIRSRDRAAVFRFSDRPELVVRFTSNHEILAGGLSSLRAEGWTALYDSIVESLYYLGGIKGRRALILLSDGMDTTSRYTFADALEYARRAGVTIYTVAIGLPPGEAQVRHQLRVLAEETGGRTFSIEAAHQLDRIYETIEAELRGQYLLGYQSSQTTMSDEFRTVEVEVDRPGLRAKTIRGYYP